MIKIKFKFNNKKASNKIKKEAILETIKDTMTKLYTNEKAVEFNKCHDIIRANHKLMNRFIDDNVNFYEINYNSINELKFLLGFCDQYCDSINKCVITMNTDRKTTTSSKKELEMTVKELNSLVQSTITKFPEAIQKYKEYLREINEKK